MFRCCSRRRECWRRKTLFWCWVVEKEDDFEDIIVVLTKVGEVGRRVIYRESVKASRLKSFFLRVFLHPKKQLLSLGFVTEKNPKLYKP